MASKEDLRVALDDALYLSGVQRSIACNAVEYKLRAAEGQSQSDIDALAAKNAEQCAALLAARQAVRADPAQKQTLEAGLAAAGIDPAVHDALLADLVAKVSPPK